MIDIRGTKSNVKVGLEWTQVTITSEPYAALSYRGLCVVVDVLISSGEKKILFIGSKSLSYALFPAAQSRSGVLTGLKLWVRRLGQTYLAPLEVSFQEEQPCS